MSNNHNGVGTPPPERRVLSMFHSSRKGVMELNLEVCVLTFNPDLPAMLGYRPATLENIPLFDLIHAEDQEQSQVAFGDLIHGDTQSFDIVARLVTALGETLWCRMLVEPMCDAHGRLDRLIAVVLNLNDHRLEEDKLRTDQDRLSTFIAAGEEGIILTRDGIILDCNAQIAAIAGITVDDLIGHSVEEFVRAADRPRLRRLIEKGQFDRDEFEVVRPDGQVIYIEVFGQRSPKDRSGASFTIVRDITEHHQRRMEFDRLNRTLRALRESSLALVSATEEKAYLNKVCKVLVDQCGYSRVSIGLLAESDTVNYTTVAQWGLNHKKVPDSFDLGALTDEHGEGITSQAIRTNRPAVCQDIRADSSLPAWHKEQILSLGGMSAASIPLALQGAVFGTLTIFASRTNALPPAEVQLLQTLSDDLAFGIQTLRSREARVKAEHDLAEKTKELEALFNTIPATVYVTDSDHRLFKANTRFQKEFKLDPDQLLGKRHSDFLPLDLAQQCKESSRLAIEQGSVSDLEETSIDENGRQRWWATAKTALFDEKNGLTRIVGVSIEITDRKLAERERYSRLKHQKDELVREVHHRIKNHLQGVIGLLRSHKSGHDSKSAIEKAVQQVMSIAQVYGLQSHRRDNKVELRELTETLRTLPMTPNIIEWEPGAKSRPVHLAKEEAVPVAVVLNELLTNAAKHLQRAAGPKSVRLSLVAESGAMMLRIRNRPATLPADFDFSERKGLGTGLGLVCSLLPTSGADLQIWQDGETVVTELMLETPVIEQPESGGQ